MSGYPLVCGMRGREGFWFRVAGWGFSVLDGRRFPPLFSERYGYTRVFRFGRFRLQGLKP